MKHHVAGCQAQEPIIGPLVSNDAANEHDIPCFGTSSFYGVLLQCDVRNLPFLCVFVYFAPSFRPSLFFLTPSSDHYTPSQLVSSLHLVHINIFAQLL